MNKNIAILAGAAVLLVIGFFIYDFAKTTPCDSLFQQTTSNFSVRLKFIESEGEVSLGGKKIQDLTEATQKTAANLRTCCTVLMSDKVTSKEFLECKDHSNRLEKKLDKIINELKTLKVVNKDIVTEEARNEISEEIKKDIEEAKAIPVQFYQTIENTRQVPTNPPAKDPSPDPAPRDPHRSGEVPTPHIDPTGGPRPSPSGQNDEKPPEVPTNTPAKGSPPDPAPRHPPPSGPVPTPPGLARYLDQGWNHETRMEWWYTSQGSWVIPSAWFLALEQADSEELVRSNANLERLRFITWPADSKWNPDGLPIGFVMSKDAASGKSYFGYTCAACHTGKIEYKGQTVIVEGGPAHSDFDLLNTEIGASMQSTLSDNDKFSRFAARVLGAEAKPPSIKELKDQLAQKTAPLAERLKVNHPPFPYGYARLDAFGNIFKPPQ